MADRGFRRCEARAHLLASSGYGYFRDELDYLACADHLAAGYVDHPPLSVYCMPVAEVWPRLKHYD